MVLSLVASTSTGLIRRLTSVGPVLTGGVSVAAAIGICIEFWAAAEVGSIKPPPAKAPASKNWRRDKRLSSCSFTVRRSSRERSLQSQGASSGAGPKPQPQNRTFLNERED